MQNTVFIVSTLLIIILFTNCNNQKNSQNATEIDSSSLSGEYLGQKPPGMIPEIFAPGIISFDSTEELNSIFSPDGKEFYFSLATPEKYTIMFVKKNNNKWEKPIVASFSGKYDDVDMFITHDGLKFFFCSSRPVNEGEPPSEGFMIWTMDRTEMGWTQPQFLESSINDGRHQVYPSLTNTGTLYFQSRRDGNIGGSDIYRSSFINGTYTKPENLGDSINTKYNEGDVLIASDESYMIVLCNERPDGYGKGDLYISFRKEDGLWTQLENMGETINTKYTEYCPALSPDEKYLFFTSRRTGKGDIYWIDAKIIEELKTKID